MMRSRVLQTSFAAMTLIGYASAQLGWSQVTAPGPFRSAHAMAFDSQRGRTVLFGGSITSDTWEWDGSAWLFVGWGPPPRQSPAMAFDSQRNRTVLYGGNGGGTQTWEWDGSVWNLAATTGPGPRTGHAMAYDSLRGRTVLFGGGSGDTWEWDGVTWQQVATTGPAPRTLHAMAFDSFRNRTVLFGGWGNTVFGDTWEWDGLAWTQRATTGPAPRIYSCMAFDSLRGLSVLFGGSANPFAVPLPGDTWEWDGSTWAQAGTGGPAGRAQTAMVYDSQRLALFVFSGNSATGIASDGWIRTGGHVATVTTYGAGCGAPAPLLAATSNTRPRLGHSQITMITNASAGFAAMAWGLSQQSLDLTFLGVAGCTLLNGAEGQVGDFCPSTSLTTAQHSFLIPNDTSLLDLEVFMQAWTLAPGFNPLGVAMSNGLKLRIGDI